MYVALSVLFAAVPLFVCYAARSFLGRSFLQPVWVFPVLFAAGAVGGVLFGAFLSAPLSLWFSGLELFVDPAILPTVIVVPVAEEIGKGIVLLLFLRTRWFRSPVDGLLYGLAAGSGFAMIENVLYFVDAYARGGGFDWAGAVVVRLPAALLVHGGATAVLGVYLAAARWNRKPLVVFGALPAALFVASLLHGGWNALMLFATREGSRAHLVGAVALLSAVAAGLAIALWVALRSEAKAIRDELTPEVDAGYLDPLDVVRASSLGAIAFRRWNRRREADPLHNTLVALAFALRRARLEGAARGEVDELRRTVRAAKHASL